MSRNSAKGTRWETAVVTFLNSFWAGQEKLKAYRPAQSGQRDHGDVHGISPFVGQAKDWKSWEAAIREGLDGAETQRVAAGEDYGVAFVKRARRTPAQGYAVMTIATWARVLLRLRRAESALALLQPGIATTHRRLSLDDLDHKGD